MKVFLDTNILNAAVDAACECIVTRNVKDFSLSEMPVYSPDDFLTMLRK